MIFRSGSVRHALLLIGVALTLPQRASASMDSCTQAHAAGQREENAGQLKEALASFEVCASDAECPLPIRNECTSLYSKVEGRLPTLVFSVVDDRGNDIVDVRVSSGDTQIANGLDGRPVAVNPGLHEFRFDLPGGEVLTKSVAVRQGEKDRIVSLTLPRKEFSATSPSEVSTDRATSADAAPDQRLTVPLASWVSYGVGVAALGAWGTFALVGRNQEQGLVDCSPNCASDKRDDYDAMKRNYLIADISLGVAAAAVAAGTVVLLTMGRRPQARADQATTAKAKRSLALAPVPLGNGGGGLMVEGRY
jgi:hypothetical protein